VHMKRKWAKKMPQQTLTKQYEGTQLLSWKIMDNANQNQRCEQQQ
jgi:hypothetical protein